jgi:hypothetical protein
MPAKEGSVQRINAQYFYRLATTLRPLAEIKPLVKLIEH